MGDWRWTRYYYNYRPSHPLNLYFAIDNDDVPGWFVFAFVRSFTCLMDGLDGH